MRALQRRLDAFGPSGQTKRSPKMRSFLGRHAPPLLRAHVRRSVELARIPGDFDSILGTKLLLAVAGLGAGLVSAQGVKAMAASLVFAAAGWRLPEFQALRRARARRRAVVASLPDMLDLLAACARAGASVGHAFELAAARDPGPLGEAMREAVRALAHGLPRDRAYEILGDHADAPEVRRVISALRRAERLGTSIAATTTDLAREVREERRARAEEGARAAPVRILFPVVVCFLPAFGLLTVAPVIIVALRGFRGV
jgi:tight adherence protein C